MSLLSTKRGITSEMSNDQKRRQQLSNFFYLLSVMNCTLDLINILALGFRGWVIFLHAAVVLIPIGIYYINGFRKFQVLAIDIFLLITNGWLFFNASIYSGEAGIQFIYFIVIFASFALLPPNQKVRLFIYPILTIVCLLVLEMTNYSLLSNLAKVSPDVIRQKYYVMFFGSVILLIFAARYIIRVANKNEKMLEAEKTELSRLNKELDKLNNYIENQNLQLTGELHEKSLELLQQQKDLNMALIEGEEKERKRLSRELHDGLGLLLSTAKIKMQTVDSSKLDKNKTIHEALELIDKACIELRLISQNLTPTLISEIGIEASLQSLIHSINSSKYIKIKLVTFGVEDIKFAEQMDVQLYRVVLELINNCIKHAYASAITVQLIYSNKELHIQVEDNGLGISKGSPSVGQGLKNIGGTVDVYNGKMDIDSSKDKGTTIMISIPV